MRIKEIVPDHATSAESRPLLLRSTSSDSSRNRVAHIWLNDCGPVRTVSHMAGGIAPSDKVTFPWDRDHGRLREVGRSTSGANGGTLSRSAPGKGICAGDPSPTVSYSPSGHSGYLGLEQSVNGLLGLGHGLFLPGVPGYAE